MREYKVIPLRGGTIVGAWAVEDPWGRVIGRTLRLDRNAADQLAFELNRAYEQGKETV